MSDAPERMWVKRDPNGALGHWHDATSDETIARIAGKHSPLYAYIRKDVSDAAIAKARAEGMREAAKIAENYDGFAMGSAYWPVAISRRILAAIGGAA